jgi:hypothetical protein
VCGRYNVYTSPLTNPQTNPNVDPKRTEPLTDEELERVISELYFEKVERIVKQNGKIKFKGKGYHVGQKMSNETVEVKITLRGVEAWHKGAFIKRWKYWVYVPTIAAGYRLEEYLL